MKVIVDRLVNSIEEPIEVEEFFEPTGSLVEVTCGDQKIRLDTKNDYELDNLIKALKFFKNYDD